MSVFYTYNLGYGIYVLINSYMSLVHYITIFSFDKEFLEDFCRLLDLGLIKGTKIKPVLISPAKDPRAYEFRGNLIAIREEDSSKIKIIF